MRRTLWKIGCTIWFVISRSIWRLRNTTLQPIGLQPTRNTFTQRILHRLPSSPEKSVTEMIKTPKFSRSVSIFFGGNGGDHEQTDFRPGRRVTPCTKVHTGRIQ